MYNLINSSKKNKIKKPEYLNIKPRHLSNFLEQSKIEKLNETVNLYQGILIKNDDLNYLQKNLNLK